MVSSRTSILKGIRQSRPDYVPRPNLGLFELNKKDLVEKFCQSVKESGGEVLDFESINELRAYISRDKRREPRLVSRLRQADIDSLPDDLEQMEGIEKAYVEAELAVAENGAVWIEENERTTRVLPFIVNHLVVVIHANNIVPNMHAAYQKLECRKTPYGVFIAGPSKTADIEQSLVIGAHGPKKHTIALLFN